MSNCSMAQIFKSLVLRPPYDEEEDLTSSSEDGSTGENIPLIQKLAPTNSLLAYFNDGIRRVDYVLVCDNKSLTNYLHRQYMLTFLEQMEQVGFQLEGEIGKVLKHLYFIKVHLPETVMKCFAEAAGMPLECSADRYEFRMEDTMWKFTATEIDLITPDSPLYKRSPDSFLKDRPSDITRCEGLIVVKKLLDRAAYNLDPYEFGIDKLLSKKVFIAAYPLHDGPYEWLPSGPLTDRQLLGHFWAKKILWYKKQPLEVIKNYFGPEFAMHCALHGFFNKMLIYGTIMGILCFLISMLVALLHDNVPARSLLQ